MNVVLIGYRGSGKTSVGRVLADLLRCPFVDTDEIVVQQAAATIAEIFAREGQAGFRNREREAIARAVANQDQVISVGGGAVESAENREMLSAYGTVVWLRGGADVLWRRINQDAESDANRPNLAEGGLEEVRSILKRREPLYSNLADIQMDTTRLDIQSIALQVQQQLERTTD